MDLGTPFWFSLSALIVSFISLGVAIYKTVLDRAKIQVSSILYQADENNTNARIVVTVTNLGRRIAVLTMLGGNLKDGGWMGTHLGDKGLGLHLAENELHRISLSFEDIFCAGLEYSDEYTELWVEDSKGIRHNVEGSKHNIQNMKENQSVRTQK